MSYNASIDIIIDKLGYIESDKLVYYKELENSKTINLSPQIIKILKDIKPYAFYCVDDKPFVLFFEDTNNRDIKALNKKIWNMQIPVVIFDNGDNIKIYNGSSLDFENIELDLIEKEKIGDLNEHTKFSYWNIGNPNFWVNYNKEYSKKKLNEFLLDNITYITKELKERYKISFATKLILRIIFIRFLIDRGIDIHYNNFSNDVDSSREELLNIVREKEKLYNLFDYLKDKFNGNLFELGNERQDQNLNNDVFSLLYDFLAGKSELSNGQECMFSMYDFNIIPVVLISNIYEILLGKEKQDSDKAFYTPEYLVRYLVNETISKYLRENRECRVLDPACGSRNFSCRIF